MLNFESAGSFFGRLTERRVHDDVEELAELGLVERADSGGVVCPFEAVHIDMRLTAPAKQPQAT